MKIVENTQIQLILEHTPWFLGTLLTIVSVGVLATTLVLLYHREWLTGEFIAGTSILVLPIAFMMLVEQRQITINETALTLHTANLIRTKQVIILIEELDRIDIESLRRPGETITTHRPVAHHKGGETPLRRGYSSGTGAADIADIADTMNTWLNAHRGG